MDNTQPNSEPQCEREKAEGLRDCRKMIADYTYPANSEPQWLKEIEERRRSITDGRWANRHDSGGHTVWTVMRQGSMLVAVCGHAETFDKSNAQFIANAPTDIDRLIAEYKALRHEALNFKSLALGRQCPSCAGPLTPSTLEVDGRTIERVTCIECRERDNYCEQQIAELKAEIRTLKEK